MENQLLLGDIKIGITRKRIRNIYIYIHPPMGKVTISAPLRASMTKIREFALSRLSWIRRSRQQLKTQHWNPPVRYHEGSLHMLWGRSYPLELRQTQGAAFVELVNNRLVVHARTLGARSVKAALDAFYISQVEEAAAPLLTKWALLMRVHLNSFTVRPMKTLWGSCTPVRQTIRLNSELAKRRSICLEYIVVHELVHLLEPSHNHRFHSFMNRFMPDWQTYQAELNRLALGTGECTALAPLPEAAA